MSFPHKIVSAEAEASFSRQTGILPAPPKSSIRSRILVVNSKGGCGKSTIATNLAGCLSSRNHSAVLMDYDLQGSSMQWLSLRNDERAKIHGIAAHRGGQSSITRSFQMRIPEGVEYVIIDAPAGISGPELIGIVHDIDTIIIPVLPSPIDIHACAYFIKELFMVARVRKKSIKIGVIANRTRPTNRIYDSLIRFLWTLDIDFICSLTDSQSYIHAAQDGLSVVELKNTTSAKDQSQWNEIINWLNR